MMERLKGTAWNTEEVIEQSFVRAFNALCKDNKK